MEQTGSSPWAFGIIPFEDIHGLGVSLPTWAAAVEYASRPPDDFSRMSTGHAKYFIHPMTDALETWITTRYEELHAEASISVQSLVKSIIRKVEACVPTTDTRRALLFPSAQGADTCKTYLRGIIDKDRKCQVSVLVTGFPSLQMRTPREQREIDWENVELHAVLYPRDLAEQAKAFWQHTCFGISSRYAEFCFKNLSETSRRNWLASSKNSIVTPFTDSLDSPVGLPYPCPLKEYGKNREIIVDRLVKLYSFSQPITAEELFLYPSGRTALTMVADAIKRSNPGDEPYEIVCYGFRCVDYFRTLSKILQIPTTMLGNSSLSELDHLLTELESGRRIAAIFLEVPGDPLLKSPNLNRIHSLSLRYNFIVVCDDTIATPLNVDILYLSDVICSSLSKMFSGACNVKSGSVVLNPKSKHFERLKTSLSATFIDTCFPLDMKQLSENSCDFEYRVQRSNNNAEVLARILDEHETVNRVFYPKGSPTQFRYDKYKRPAGGYGHLLSVLFKRSVQAIAFYDAIEVAKGPTFGTNYTIACPYTILAHNEEIEWAGDFGVKEFLIRISVGVEKCAVLKRKIEGALLAAKKAAA